MPALFRGETRPRSTGPPHPNHDAALPLCATCAVDTRARPSARRSSSTTHTNEKKRGAPCGAPREEAMARCFLLVAAATSEAEEAEQRNRRSRGARGSGAEGVDRL